MIVSVLRFNSWLLSLRLGVRVEAQAREEWKSEKHLRDRVEADFGSSARSQIDP